ncbi:hypothetical protein DTO212C5_6311 [Paecilomyces variotii]|nr:hypothetical protein DTO212C5_6311 [Paecilomyces variotii]
MRSKKLPQRVINILTAVSDTTGFQKIKGYVCLLKQALYGLRQSAFLWNETFTDELKDMGFEPLDEDPCILIRCAEDYIVIYVDDMIIAATTDEGIGRFINELSSRFNTKILGEPSRFLGCKLVRNIDDDTITMSQSAYVPDILKES